MAGSIFVISGPSGSGKSTITGELRKRLPGLGYSISHTTRKPREGEIDGKDYHFVSLAVFREMERKGLFVETADNYGSMYGTSRASLDTLLERGLDVVLDLDHRGAFSIKEKFPAGSLIYILPPSIEELKRRLSQRRSEAEEELDRRLSSALAEIAQCYRFDFLIVNDKLEDAVRQAESIVLAQRCRLRNMVSVVGKLFPNLPEGVPSD